MQSRSSFVVRSPTNTFRWSASPLKLQNRNPPIVHLKDARIYSYGTVQRPLLRVPELKVEGDESWAVLGSLKTVVFQTLLGKHRVVPPQTNGIFPFLSVSSQGALDPQGKVALVSFAYTRRAPVGGSAGDFYDFTARYGAMRDEDRLTLRQSLISEAEASSKNNVDEEVEKLAERVAIKHLLDVPLVGLSNGQMRRAKIISHLLRKPAVLLLDEPLTGLDIKQRPSLLNLLHELHRKSDPVIILGLRPQDSLPEWVTHVAHSQDGYVLTGPKTSPEIQARLAEPSPMVWTKEKEGSPIARPKGEALVEMKNINVAYQGRKVLQNINWTIRQGEIWHLKGPNGSGKTTLLSILNGTHPQSYTQPTPSLTLFSKPRKILATAQLGRLIGQTSPEMFHAFPRRGMTVRESIGTGFEGVFSYRGRSAAEEVRIDEVLSGFGKGEKEWSERLFVELSVGEQALVLLMRAVVGEPPLVILDEPFAGMDDETVRTAKRYLRDNIKSSQAVVFITHWEEEMPWRGEEVLKLTLQEGGIQQLSEL